MEQTTITQLFADETRCHPAAAALLAPDRRALTYGELRAQVAQGAARLRGLGIARGDRVAIVLPNGPEMALAFLCTAHVATAAPLNPAYRAAEFDFYLGDLDARALLVPAGSDSPAVQVARARGIAVLELTPRAGGPAGLFELDGEPSGQRAADAAAQPDDVALMLHTSGTTSRPKMVPLTHHNLLASAESICRSLQLTPADRCLNVMPLFHIHGLAAALLATLAAGASVVCTPGFLAPLFFSWLEAFRPTWYSAVPTMHQAILARAPANRAAIAAAPLRFIRSCSAALPPRVMAELEAAFGAPAVEAYGMTEAAHQMASNPLPPGIRKPGSVGVAAGPQVAIMAPDDDGLLAPGQTGEIVIRGPNVMSGYVGAAEANARAWASGWFRTGDQGHLDAAGYLYLTGRIKEIINRGGEKIAPREIDEVLLEHPAVAQAVAFAMPDVELGEEVGAAVVLSAPGVSELELRRFVATRLAPFKVPRRIALVTEIPKGPTGKIQRIGLAARLGLADAPATAAPADAPHAPPSSDAERLLAGLWSQVLKRTGFGVHDRFVDLGGDSILATQLVARLRQTLGIDLGLVDFFEAPTVAQQALLVERLLLDEIEALPEDEAERQARGDGPEGR